MNDFIFDDGTTITQDDGGNVVGATDQNGRAVEVAGREGSSIVQQFADLFNYGARSAIDANFKGTKGTPANVALVQATPAAQLQRLMPLLILVAVGAVAFKLLKS